MNKIEETFLENPEKEFHIREIAKLLDLSPTTVSKKTKQMVKNGLLVIRKVSNHVMLKSNTNSFNFICLKKEYNLQRFLDSEILDYLNNQLNNPETIILFGSYAKGENINSSDIDLLVITPLNKKINLIKFEKKLGYKIQLFMYSYLDIEKMKTNNKELLNTFVNGVVLSGHWELFR